MINKDQELLQEAYESILNEKLSSKQMEKELSDCEQIIMKLSKGQFKNQSEETMEKVKNCKKLFTVTQDSKGHYTVIIKDSALTKIEALYPKLAGKFKSAADCKKDVEACRKDKLK